MRMIAKVIAWAILALAIVTPAVLLIAGVLISRPGHAAETAPWKWEHFGAAPYAATRDEAMATRESAFVKLGFPAEVVRLLVEATKSPGEKTAMQNGDVFEAQVSKGGVVHGLVESGGIVAFATPVRGIRYVADGEKWTVIWENRIYTLTLPEVCWNWTRGITRTFRPSATPARSITAASAAPVGSCPSGYTLIANAWELSKLPEAMRRQAEALIAAAERRDTKNATDPEAYKPDAFSRRLGGQLRREVKERALVSVHIPAQLRHPTDLTVVEAVGPLNLVDGVGRLILSKEQTAYIVETIWPGDFKSPTVSGGARRLWLFPEEWGDNCAMNVHGAKP